MATAIKERISPNMKMLFCPSCHRRIFSPIDNSVVFAGTLRLSCGCKKGVVVVKPNKKESSETKGSLE